MVYYWISTEVFSINLLLIFDKITFYGVDFLSVDELKLPPLIGEKLFVLNFLFRFEKLSESIERFTLLGVF